jgi:hypothetical protein
MGQMSFEEKKVTGRQCPEFRVSFENIHKPRAFKEGMEAKYSVTMLFPKNADLKELKRAAANAASEKWGDDKSRWPKNLKTPFRNGDKESDQEDYAGKIFVRASSKEKPALVDQKLDPIPSDENGRAVFYSGCYARASLVAFAYDTQGNRGISFSVMSVQKTRDGERFGGRRSAVDEFDAVEDSSEKESSYESSDDSDSFGL